MVRVVIRDGRIKIAVCQKTLSGYGSCSAPRSIMPGEKPAYRIETSALCNRSSVKAGRRILLGTYFHYSAHFLAKLSGDASGEHLYRFNLVRFDGGRERRRAIVVFRKTIHH